MKLRQLLWVISCTSSIFWFLSNAMAQCSSSNETLTLSKEMVAFDDYKSCEEVVEKRLTSLPGQPTYMHELCSVVRNELEEECTAKRSEMWDVCPTRSAPPVSCAPPAILAPEVGSTEKCSEEYSADGLEMIIVTCTATCSYTCIAKIELNAIDQRNTGKSSVQGISQALYQANSSQEDDFAAE